MHEVWSKCSTEDCEQHEHQRSSGYPADKSLCPGKPTIAPLDSSKIAEDGQDGARKSAHHDNSHELLYTSADVVTVFLHLTLHLG